MGALGRVLMGLLITALVSVLVITGLVVIYNYDKAPLPLADQCVARVQGDTVGLDTEQAHYASIIAGVSTQHELVPRAATIALATAYQESGIRNLDHGDRDSLGLFQQRPSQGWGTPAQVQDPYYAADKFFDALVKVPNWRTGDVNDVAQTVQRSGHPNGYARHVENARRLASSLTGETPASLSCVVREAAPSDPAGLADFLRRTLPSSSKVTLSGDTVRVRAASNQAAWSAAHVAVANTARFGVQRVEVGPRHWTVSASSTAPWLGETDQSTTVVIRFPTAASATPTPGR